MQGQKKYLVILCLLLFVFGGAYAGMRGYNGRQEEKENSETEASKIYVVREKAEEITAFSYQNGGDSAVCQRRQHLGDETGRFAHVKSDACRRYYR